MTISPGMKTLLAAIALSGLTIGTTERSHALTIIDTTPIAGFASQIGQPDRATFGQTFTVPVNGDTVLDNFSFFVGQFQISPNPVQFKGYVMAWDGSKATGSILYQSGLQVTKQPSVLSEFNFATGGINLIAGQQYVAFLSTTGFPTSGFGYLGLSADVYAGGRLVSQNNGTDFSQLTTNAWNSSAGHDLGFIASFSSPAPSIPTPALLPGLIGMGIAAIRRRKAEASGSTSDA